MSLGHGAGIVRNGLVLHLDSASVKSYPGSGTSWFNLKNTSSNGTLINSPTYSNGAITFNGTNQYVTFNSIPEIQFLGTSTYSLNAWFYLSSIPTVNTYRGIINRESTFNSVRDGYNLWLNQESSGSLRIGTERFGTGTQTGSVMNYDSSTLLNKWTNVCVTYNGSLIVLYVNSTQVSSNSSTSSIANTSKNLEIATRNGGAYFPGSIPSISIYNTVLTDTQVKQNFEALRGRYGI